jgi:hypothetical protein
MRTELALCLKFYSAACMCSKQCAKQGSRNDKDSEGIAPDSCVSSP